VNSELAPFAQLTAGFTAAACLTTQLGGLKNA
jgi:hypothetical protein